MSFYKSITRALLLLLASVASSCTMLYEDLSECNLYLKFRYDYNLAYEDWFSEQVDQVRVFVFDKQGKYIQTITDLSPEVRVPGYRLQIPFEMRGNAMVVWAGRVEDSYQLAPMSPGDPIEKLTLTYQPTNQTSRAHIATKWHSGPHLMEFSESNGTEQTVGLVRNTNDIYIAMSDGGAATTTRFNFALSGANGSYDYKNAFLDRNPTITYEPVEEPQAAPSMSRVPSQELAAKIYTMRLVKGAPLMFSAQDNFSGKNILIEGKDEVDLTELLLKSKPSTMTEQEYLDRRYTWDLTLNYNERTFIAVSITINGWTHWFHETEL